MPRRITNSKAIELHGRDGVTISEEVHRLMPIRLNFQNCYWISISSISFKRKWLLLRNINNLRYADDTTLMAERKEELKSLLMKVKEESEKVALKLNFQKTKIMSSGPITSWQIYGEAVETISDFIFLGSKITADGDCRHEIKGCLLLGRKVMTNLTAY